MEGSELTRMRRSIRKYRNEQIPRDALEKIIEAGLYAPSAGGRQGTLIIAVHDRALAEKIGRMNLGKFDRSCLLGSFVSKEQPSAIDDPTIRNGFYGAPTGCAVFAPKHFLFSIPDAFCAAENMVLLAADLGIASCIVSRGEETFDSAEGARFFGNGRSRKAILHGVSLRSAIATAPTRSRKRGKKADG